MSLCLKIPASKSHTMRALLFALMANGTSRLFNPLPSPDTEAMIHAMEQLGARVIPIDGGVEVEGTGGRFQAPAEPIDAGNSGQVLRFIGALAALSPHPFVVTGDASICARRPVAALLEGLIQLGAQARALEVPEHAPIAIQGPIRPGRAVIDGADSQPVSALLMASAFMPGPTEIFVKSPGETPWVALTLDWLKRFGVEVVCDSFEHYRVPGSAEIAPFECTIPGDFSTAAYPLVGALITGQEVTLQGLDPDDVQGDKGVIEVLEKMGADITWVGGDLVVRPSTFCGCVVDVNPIIDALPILAVVGCFADGETELVGGEIARLKESDRIHAIATELAKMGAEIEERADGLLVRKSRLKGALVSSHADHRIALSLAVASLGAEGKVVIEGQGCIAKSYPTFAEHIKALEGG